MWQDALLPVPRVRRWMRRRFSIAVRGRRSPPPEGAPGRWPAPRGLLPRPRPATTTKAVRRGQCGRMRDRRSGAASGAQGRGRRRSRRRAAVPTARDHRRHRSFWAVRPNRHPRRSPRSEPPPAAQGRRLPLGPAHAASAWPARWPRPSDLHHGPRDASYRQAKATTTFGAIDTSRPESVQRQVQPLRVRAGC